MPFYEYQCRACGHEDTMLESMKAGRIKKCPSCGKLRSFIRLVSMSSFRLKGSGWYVTDFRDGDRKKEAASADGEASKESVAADGAAKEAKGAAVAGSEESSGATGASGASGAEAADAAAGAAKGAKQKSGSAKTQPADGAAARKRSAAP